MALRQELHTGDAAQAEEQLAWSRTYLRREKRRRILRRSALTLAVAMGCVFTVYAAAFGLPRIHTGAPSSSAPASVSRAPAAGQSGSASGAQGAAAGRCTVTLDSRGGTELAPVTGLAAGSLVPRPGDPVREGYAFGGWYRDIARTQAWDFSGDTVEEDMTLYARWVALPSSGGDESLPQTGVETRAVVWGAVLAGALCLAALAALLLRRAYQRR